MTAGANPLDGMRVLVLEDEALVAMLLEDMLADLGCSTVGPFAELGDATAFVETEPRGMDAAIIDVNVAGQPSYPLAAALAAGGVPFAFSTGYDISGIAAEWRGRPWLRKPFMLPDLEQVLGTLRAGAPAC
jgi:CheY-like chemotaxis protein